LTADDTAQRESRLLPTISAPSPNGLGAVFFIYMVYSNLQFVV
jgi:hypothetical protein